MARTVSEQMQQRKQQKFKRELSKVLSSQSATNLNGFVAGIFEYHSNKPTADHFVEMVLASKYGSGNSIAEGGVEFMEETCLKAFNLLPITNKFSDAELQPWGSYHTGTYDMNDLWNAMFLFEIDANLYPYVTEIEIDDLFWAQDISPYLFLDKVTQAFGFVLVPLPPMTLDEYKEYGRDYFTNWEVKVERSFEKSGFAGFEVLDFSTGPMEYISAVQIIFGTVDKLVRSLPNRDQHNVTSHERKLQSGKTATVRAHKRKTPLRLVVNNRALTDHIVYSVKDDNGQVRYIGEGKRDRFKHVNSGASHNWKINEHFFTKGQMDVEILQKGLTKSEALSIEKLLIKKNSNTALWNVKDYEPFNTESEQAISDQEIQSFFDV